MIWIAVWCENMCQWNCTGRPVISYLRMSSGLIFQRALSPMLRLHWRCYLPHTEQSLRIHVRLFSTDVLQMTPMETNDFRIRIANFAILKLHRKLPQRLWGLAVWIAQVQCSCVFCEFDDSPEFPRIYHLLHSNTQRPTYNRSWACSKLLHAWRNGPTCWCLSEIVSTCFHHLFTLHLNLLTAHTPAPTAPSLSFTLLFFLEYVQRIPSPPESFFLQLSIFTFCANYCTFTVAVTRKCFHADLADSSFSLQKPTPHQLVCCFTLGSQTLWLAHSLFCGSGKQSPWLDPLRFSQLFLGPDSPMPHCYVVYSPLVVSGPTGPMLPSLGCCVPSVDSGLDVRTLLCLFASPVEVSFTSVSCFFFIFVSSIRSYVWLFVGFLGASPPFSGTWRRTPSVGVTGSWVPTLSGFFLGSWIHFRFCCSFLLPTAPPHQSWTPTWWKSDDNDTLYSSSYSLRSTFTIGTLFSWQLLRGLLHQHRFSIMCCPQHRVHWFVRRRLEFVQNFGKLGASTRSRLTKTMPPATGYGPQLPKQPLLSAAFWTTVFLYFRWFHLAVETDDPAVNCSNHWRSTSWQANLQPW